MKNAQIEMVGLLLIVILIVLGGLFYLAFVVLQPSSTIEESTIRTTQAYNLLNALIPLELCPGKTIKQAISNCDTTPHEQFCEATTSCTALTDRLPSILTPVIDQTLGLNYSLTVQTPTQHLALVQGCTRGTLLNYSFSDDTGTSYELALKLCKL